MRAYLICSSTWIRIRFLWKMVESYFIQNLRPPTASKMHFSIFSLVRLIDKFLAIYAYLMLSSLWINIKNSKKLKLFFTDDDETLESSKEDELTSQLRVLRKTRRKTKFNPQKQRSKYICIPRQVKEAGNHFIWETLGWLFVSKSREESKGKAILHRFGQNPTSPLGWMD